MLYEKKVERAMEWLKSQNKNPKDDTQVDDPHLENDTRVESKMEAYDEGIQEEFEPLEKKDILAISLSALLIIAPVILAVLGLYVLIAYLMFG